MVYEKKMLILTGEGSGVVMIEKSARGVRFALRTLGVARSDNMRAGIITRKAVYVRDLPSESDPSAVFFIDDAETDFLHFAVFDAKLLLYGTTAPTRMWEANIMDLLNKYGAPVILPEKVLPTLPPVSVPPTVLPAPDGTGIPQTRLAIYGDDSLAESDMYTTVDLSARMRVVDDFLDTPRASDKSLDALYSGIATIDETNEISDGAHEVNSVSADQDPFRDVHAETTTAAPPASALDGLSPHIMPPPDIPAYMLFPPDRDLSVSTTAAVDAPSQKADTESETAETGQHRAQADVTAEAASVMGAEDDISERKEPVENGGIESDGNTAVSAHADTNDMTAAQKVDAVKSFVSDDVIPEPTKAEATATAEPSDETAMPWALTAKWLKSRSGREPVVRHERVHMVTHKTDIKALREIAFFERCRADIEKLFSAAPRDEELTALLPDIDWVNVEIGENTVGVGKSDNAFLCYAVPGIYEKSSPLGEEAQWLPKLKNAPTGKGYWLIFQDLISGEIIGN